MMLPNLVGPWVDVRSFAPPEHPRDGTKPWDAYIQAAVDYVVQHTLGDVPPGSVGTVYLPPGRYPLLSPIRIRRILDCAYQFCSVRIRGDALPYGSSNFHGSALIAEFFDKPAVIIQAGRAVWIENLAIEGKNNWTAIHDLKTPEPLYDDANFVVPGVADDRRFAPYAGICIDPFYDQGALQTTFPNFEMYSGLEAEYLPSAGSSAIWIQRCSISNFVVGIAISPNGITQNAENISIDDCGITSTKSAIAICQDQSRAVTCRNLGVYAAKYAIDCRFYGKGSGNCPSIFGANIGWVKYLFNTYSFGSGAALDGIYCEAVLSIGVLGGGGAYDGYVFNGCSFNLFWVGTRPSVGYHLANLARATFNACRISLSEFRTDKQAPLPAPLWIIGGRQSFHDCELSTVNPDNSPSVWIMNAPWGTSFDNCPVSYAPLGALFSRVLSMDHISNIVNQAVLPGSFIHQVTDPVPDDPLRWVASALRQIPLGKAWSPAPYLPGLSLDPATGTATFHTTTLGLVAPGDLISMDQTYSDVIEGYTGADFWVMLGKVQAVSQVKVKGLTSVTVGRVPDYVFKTPPGKDTHYYVVGYPKIHQPTIGVTTSSDYTKVIFSPSLGPNAWLVGDRIRDDQGYITPDTFVSAVGTNPNTGALESLTLSLRTDLKKGPPPDGTMLKLYDAEVRAFNSTQVY